MRNTIEILIFLIQICVHHEANGLKCYWSIGRKRRSVGINKYTAVPRKLPFIANGTATCEYTNDFCYVKEGGRTSGCVSELNALHICKGLHGCLLCNQDYCNSMSWVAKSFKISKLQCYNPSNEELTCPSHPEQSCYLARGYEKGEPVQHKGCASRKEVLDKCKSMKHEGLECISCNTPLCNLRSVKKCYTCQDPSGKCEKQIATSCPHDSDRDEYVCLTVRGKHYNGSLYHGKFCELSYEFATDKCRRYEEQEHLMNISLCRACYSDLCDNNDVKNKSGSGITSKKRSSASYTTPITNVVLMTVLFYLLRMIPTYK